MIFKSVTVHLCSQVYCQGWTLLGHVSEYVYFVGHVTAPVGCQTLTFPVQESSMSAQCRSNCDMQVILSVCLRPVLQITQ